MDKNKTISLVIVIIIIVVAIVFIQKPFSKTDSAEFGIIDADNTGINIGDIAPDFILESLEGEPLRLSNLRGKAVVINFWATWCPPCREEMPAFEQIFQQNKDELEILGVDLQERPETIRKFLEEIPVTYPLLLDPNSEVKGAYNIFTQPVTYFLDKDGKIVDKKFGFLIEEEIVEKFGKIGIEVVFE